MRTYKRALIIDDDTDLCMMLKSIVGQAVPRVQCAQTIAAGRKLLNQLHPDVVILDNNLPDGQGLQLVKEIKKRLRAYIIFITAVDTPKQKALENGADVFLEKPFTYSAIFQALDGDTNAAHT